MLDNNKYLWEMPAEIVTFNATMHPILKDFAEIMVAINALYSKSFAE